LLHIHIVTWQVARNLAHSSYIWNVPTVMLLQQIPYSRKLSQIGDFRRENFHRLLIRAMLKDTMSPNFAEKTFANSHKTAKLAKVYSLQSFPLYGSLYFLPILCFLASKIWID